MTGPVHSSARSAGFVAVLVCAVAAALTLAGAAVSQPSGRAPLTVVVLGKGATVVSTPAGISCPRRCTATFASGTLVRLVPKLKGGFQLVRWAGGCKGRGACAVKTVSPSAVTAVFAVAPKGKPRPGSRPTPVAKVVSEPGHYTGSISFFVSTSSTTVQNITTYNPVPLACVPAVSGAPSNDSASRFVIPSVALKRDGSFVGRATQDGVFGGNTAKITVSVSGHLTPATTSGAQATGAGSYRKDITFRDASGPHTCTSNDQTWSSTKDGPIPAPKSLVVPGKTYSGLVKFTVSANGTGLQDVTTYNPVYFTCLPASSGVPANDSGSRFSIPVVAIKPDGSFAGRATQKAVIANAPATITDSVAGNFEGMRGSYAYAAGTYREDITFTDAAGTHSCTSNTLPFSSYG